MYFQRRYRLDFFLPCGPMLTKTKKNRKKSKSEILKNKKQLSGDMVKRYVSTKFGINLLDRF